jgi:hypothetical protein
MNDLLKLKKKRSLETPPTIVEVRDNLHTKELVVKSPVPKDCKKP